MTRFEEIGSEIQRSAHSKENAKTMFEKSCNICCCTGVRIDCDRCAIAYAHNLVVSVFERKAVAV